MSVHPSVTSRYRDHIGWKSSKIILELVSLGCLLSADPNITDLLQGELADDPLTVECCHLPTTALTTWQFSWPARLFCVLVILEKQLLICGHFYSPALKCQNCVFRYCIQDCWLACKLTGGFIYWGSIVPAMYFSRCLPCSSNFGTPLGVTNPIPSSLSCLVSLKIQLKMRLTDRLLAIPHPLQASSDADPPCNLSSTHTLGGST